MKRENRWQVTLALILIALATAVYYIHFLIFRDVHHIFLYFVGDVGFVFFEVLLVTLVIHRLLHHREQKALRNKLNMLIGAFFSEAGTELLGKLAAFLPVVNRPMDGLHEASADRLSASVFVGHPDQPLR